MTCGVSYRHEILNWNEINYSNNFEKVVKLKQIMIDSVLTCVYASWQWIVHLMNMLMRFILHFDLSQALSRLYNIKRSVILIIYIQSQLIFVT